MENRASRHESAGRLAGRLFFTLVNDVLPPYFSTPFICFLRTDALAGVCHFAKSDSRWHTSDNANVALDTIYGVAKGEFAKLPYGHGPRLIGAQGHGRQGLYLAEGTASHAELYSHLNPMPFVEGNRLRPLARDLGQQENVNMKSVTNDSIS